MKIYTIEQKLMKMKLGNITRCISAQNARKFINFIDPFFKVVGPTSFSIEIVFLRTEKNYERRGFFLSADVIPHV